jgi:hypothetical protein
MEILGRMAGSYVVGRLGREIAISRLRPGESSPRRRFWPAAILLSLAFAGDHLVKPMENAPDILSLVLFGLFTCYTVRRTGSLWFAIGFHAAFDFSRWPIRQLDRKQFAECSSKLSR